MSEERRPCVHGHISTVPIGASDRRDDARASPFTLSARGGWALEFAMDDVAALARVSIAAFWVLFAAASLVADRDWAPWASSRLRAFAARGKNGAEDDPRAWTVPHAWFTHFYVVGACWNAIVALHALRAASRVSTPLADDAALASILFQIHVVRGDFSGPSSSRATDPARAHARHGIPRRDHLLPPRTAHPRRDPDRRGARGIRRRRGVEDARASFAPRSNPASLSGKPLPRRSVSSADTRARRKTRTWSHRGRFRPPRFVSRGYRSAPRRGRSATRVRTNTTARSPTPSPAEEGCREGCRVDDGRATRRERGVAAADGRRRNARRATNRARTRARRAAAAAGRCGTPSGGWFDRVVCPHYAAEVLLYAGLCAMVGKEGVWVNLAMLAAVFGNLALAAGRQREWYEANAPGCSFGGGGR